MTERHGLEGFVDRAMSLASALCTVRFGPLVAQILVNDRARPQGFERALLETSQKEKWRFAIVTGDDPVLRRFVPPAADEIQVLSRPDIYAYWRPAPERGFFVLDRRAGCGVCWFPDDNAPAWAIGQPCSPLLPAALEGTGWCLCHAGAVGRRGQFLLLTGPGKAGKSTATLACVRAGWDYAGDDFVLVNPAARQVAPLYSSVRLRETGAALFQSLADSAFMISDDEGAARFELRLATPPSGGTVAAILNIARRGSADVQFVSTRPPQFLGPLLRDSTARAPGSAAAMTPLLLQVARMAPAYHVDTGPTPLAIAPGFDAFLGAMA